MRDKAGLILPIKFGLIIVLFLMPFVEISCGGIVKVQFSGMDLATGKTIEIGEEEETIDPEPLATIALGCALLGLLASFVKSKLARIFNAALGGGGAISLLQLKNKIDKGVGQCIKEGFMCAADYKFAFWATLILFIAAAAVSIYLSEAKE